ncbi:MAG TPA: hypothetical protein VIY52_11315 [Streptosporangiaceae bacterium]
MDDTVEQVLGEMPLVGHGAAGQVREIVAAPAPSASINCQSMAGVTPAAGEESARILGGPP